MKLLLLACVLLGGCTSLSNYCEEHPVPCAVGTGVLIVGAAAVFIKKGPSSNTVPVIKNPPPKN